jgi:apolipoprotein N-acyltransferase
MGPAGGPRLAFDVMSVAALAHVRPSERRSARGLLRPIAAVALSAALYGLAFAPLPGAWAAAWIALVPFFAAAAGAAPLGAAALGLLYGVALGVATCWWLPEMLERYFAMGPAAAALATVAAFAAFCGVHFAAFAAWLAWVARRGPVSPALVACGFAACEWARASLAVGNPWGLVAYSQVDVRTLAQLADLAGPWGIGALVAFANAAVAGLFVPALRGRRPVANAAALALALVAAFAYGRVQLGRELASGPATRVVLVQGGIARPDSDPTRSASRSRAELERHLALTAEAAAEAAPALVIWPEGALDFSPFELTQRSLRLRDATRKLAADLVVGAPRRDESGARYNAMVHLRRGRVANVYDKVDLMPFAERSALSFGRDAYAPGPEIRLLDAAGLRIGAAICSEAMAPDHTRRLVAAGATILANPSNDYWFTSAAAARQQLAKARFRAIETRRFVVRATSTGYSAIIDPKGDVTALSGFGGAEWIAGDVRAATSETVHQRAGGALGPALLLVSALAPFLRRTRHHGALHR